MGTHVVSCRCEVACAQGSRAGAYPFAAEAEAAIDFADCDQLDQDPIGIAMNQPPDWAHDVITDRIVALGGIADKLARVRNEMKRDRGARVFQLDEGGKRRRKADRITLGDRLELRKPFRADQPRFDEILGAGEAAALAS